MHFFFIGSRDFLVGSISTPLVTKTRSKRMAVVCCIGQHNRSNRPLSLGAGECWSIGYLPHTTPSKYMPQVMYLCYCKHWLLSMLHRLKYKVTYTLWVGTSLSHWVGVGLWYAGQMFPAINLHTTLSKLMMLLYVQALLTMTSHQTNAVLLQLIARPQTPPAVTISTCQETRKA